MESSQQQIPPARPNSAVSLAVAIRTLSGLQTPVSSPSYPTSPSLENLELFLCRGRRWPSELLILLNHKINSADPELIELISSFNPEIEESFDLFESSIIDLLLNELEPVFNSIFSDCSTDYGKQLSADERKLKKMELNHMSLTYGEVEFRTLAKMMAKNYSFPSIESEQKLNFLDVGSGTGRGLIAANLIHQFHHYYGIEILNSLVHASKCVIYKAVDLYPALFQLNKFSIIEGDFRNSFENNEMKNESEGEEEEESNKINENTSNTNIDTNTENNNNSTRTDTTDNNNSTSIEYDITASTIPWSDIHYLFTNSTCFDGQLMRDLAVIVQRMPLGSAVITLTNRLNSSHFRLINSESFDMSFGLATLHAHIKCRPPKNSVIQWKKVEKIEYFIENEQLKNRRIPGEKNSSNSVSGSGGSKENSNSKSTTKEKENSNKKSENQNENNENKQ